MRKLFPLLILLSLTISTIQSTFHINSADDDGLSLECIDKNNYFVCNNTECLCPFTEKLTTFSLILRVISPLSTLTLILGYILVKNLRQQPGGFFLGFAIGELALFLISTIESFENSRKETDNGINAPASICFGIALTRVFFRRAIRLYHICFMIYYLMSLQSSLKASKVSQTLYHTIPWLTAVCLVINECKKGTLGKTIVGTCDVKSSAEPGRYAVDLILSLICLVVTCILIPRFSSRGRNMGPQTKRQIRYYLSYFVFANLFLLITFMAKVYSSHKINNYLRSKTEYDMLENIQGTLLAEYSVIYIDICSPIILTIIRLFDPSMGKYWSQFFKKILCCCCPSRSSRKQSEQNYYFEFDGDHSRSITLSLKANEISALIEKSSFIDQVQYNSRVQVVYSLLAAIHYNWKHNPRRKSTVRAGPKDDAYFNRKTKITNKYQINDHIIEETLPEVMEEVRSKNQAIIPGRLTVHAPEVFEEITRLDGIGSSLIESLDLGKNCTRILKSGNADGGRSGEFFFFSNDNRLIIKTISNEELDVLLGSLPRFLRHFQRNPNSIIAKIYAAFTFEVKNPYEKYHLILMRNINGYPSSCTERKYDLKGATVDRSVLRNAELRRSLLKFHGTMKDLDFDQHECKLHLTEEVQNTLLDTIIKDVSFLRMEALIDYSLAVYLVNKARLNSQPTSLENSLAVRAEANHKTSLDIEVNGDPKSPKLDPQREGSMLVASPLLSIKSTKEDLYYHLGIIDYLTKYDFKKRSEKFFKQVKALNWKLDTSCQDPHTYNKRFLGYMEKIILEDYAFNVNQSLAL